MLFNILLFHLITRLTREDDQFADDILATEVDAWVGLAIALLLGQSYGLGERNLLTERYLFLPESDKFVLLTKDNYMQYIDD